MTVGSPNVSINDLPALREGDSWKSSGAGGFGNYTPEQLIEMILALMQRVGLIEDQPPVTEEEIIPIVTEVIGSIPVTVGDGTISVQDLLNEIIAKAEQVSADAIATENYKKAVDIVQMAVAMAEDRIALVEQNVENVRVAVDNARGLVDTARDETIQYHDATNVILTDAQNVLASVEAVRDQTVVASDSAATSAGEAASSASAASTSASEAATYADAAGNSASQAATYATNAANSASAASNSEGNALTYASQSATSASNAAGSAAQAASSAQLAADSETAAGNSATAASGSATTAQSAATDAQSYASFAQDQYNQTTARFNEVDIIANLDVQLMYDFEGDNDSWTLYGGNATLTNDGHDAIITSTETNAGYVGMLSPTGLALDPADHQYIVIRLTTYANPADLRTMYFRYGTTGAGSHGIHNTGYQKILTTAVPDVGATNVILIRASDLPIATDWNDATTIDHIGIVFPGNTNGLVLHAEAIYLGKYSGLGASAVASAQSWATISQTAASDAETAYANVVTQTGIATQAATDAGNSAASALTHEQNAESFANDALAYSTASENSSISADASATAAGGSATNAANSATAAATSATSAQGYADAAQAYSLVTQDNRIVATAASEFAKYQKAHPTYVWTFDANNSQVAWGNTTGNDVAPVIEAGELKLTVQPGDQPSAGTSGTSISIDGSEYILVVVKAKLPAGSNMDAMNPRLGYLTTARTGSYYFLTPIVPALQNADGTVYYYYFAHADYAVGGFDWTTSTINKISVWTDYAASVSSYYVYIDSVYVLAEDPNYVYNQATAAAGYASSAEASETAAGQYAAAANTSATNASTSAADANTYAGQASTSATDAAGSAATATSQAGLATTAANNAGTSATNAQNSATSAASSASDAAGSASAASNSATLATQAATNAGDSEDNAGTFASNASNSATSAAASATTATNAASAAYNSQQLSAASSLDASGFATEAQRQQFLAEINAIVASSLDIETDDGWYSFDAGVEGWENIVGTTLSAANSNLNVVTTNTDPHIQSPVIAIDGSIYDKVVIRMRVNSTVPTAINTEWQLFYSTSGHSWSGSYYARPMYYDSYQLTQGEYFVLVFDMANLAAGGDDWITNTITRLRFDPGNVNNADFDIDFVAVCRMDPANPIFQSAQASIFASNAQVSANQAATSETNAAGSAATASTQASLSASSASSAITALAGVEVHVANSGSERPIPGAWTNQNGGSPETAANAEDHAQASLSGGALVSTNSLASYGPKQVFPAYDGVVYEVEADLELVSGSGSLSIYSYSMDDAYVNLPGGYIGTYSGGSSGRVTVVRRFAYDSTGISNCQNWVNPTDTRKLRFKAYFGSGAVGKIYSITVRDVTALVAAEAQAAQALQSAANAAISESNAATSETNAAGSAATAATQATISTNAASTSTLASQVAIDQLVAIFPENFNHGNEHITGNTTGAPTDAPTTPMPVVTDGTFGQALQVTGSNVVSHKGVLPATPGRVYEETIVYRVITNDTNDGQNFFSVGFAVLDANYAWVSYVTDTVYKTVSDGVVTVTKRVSDVADATYGIAAWPASAVWLRPRNHCQYTDAGTARTVIKSVTIKDITEVINAQRAQAQASTYATNASISATAAATSASNAAGSASAAATSQTLATSAAGTATTLANRIYHSDFNNGADYWLSGYGYAKSALDTTNAIDSYGDISLVAVSGIGSVLQTGGIYRVSSERVTRPFIDGQIIRVTMRERITVDAPAANKTRVWLVGVDANGNYTSYWLVADWPNYLASAGWQTHSVDIDPMDVRDNIATNTFANSTEWRIMLGLNYSGSTGGVQQYQYINIDDVTSENASSGYATNASISASQSAASATTAQGAASTATTQAGIATSAANSAGASATNASTYASQAATSATNAANSASTASTQAGISTSAATNSQASADAAIAASASLFPSTFGSSTAHMTHATSGSPSTVGDMTSPVVTDGTLGSCIEATGQTIVSHKDVLPATAGKIYEISCKFRVTVNDTNNGVNSTYWGFIQLDANYGIYSYNTQTNTNFTVANGVQTKTLRVSDTANATYNIVAWEPATVWLRPRMVLNYTDASTAKTVIQEISVKDITEVINAQISQAGAASSAAAASVSASSAASSATSAAGSASTASTQAGIATSSAYTAQQVADQSYRADFNNDGANYWVNGYTLSKDQYSTLPSIDEAVGSVTLVQVTGVGTVLQYAGLYTIQSERRSRPIIDGQRFRLSIRTRLTVDRTSGTHQFQFYLTGTKADGSYAGYAGVQAWSGLTVADGWVTRTVEFVPSTIKSNAGGSGFGLATEWHIMLGGNGYNPNGTAGETQQFAWIQIDDITSETAAAASAASALTYSNNAATSASNAAGSASTASTQAGLAASASSAAAGSATAAANSATSASASANSAGQIEANVQQMNNIAIRVAAGMAITPNPVFENWSGTLPDGAIGWGNAAVITKDTVNAKYGTQAVRMAPTDTTATGFYFSTDLGDVNYEYLVVDAEVEFLSGTPTGWGLYMYHRNTAGSNYTIGDSTATMRYDNWEDRGNGVYTFKKVVRRGAAFTGTLDYYVLYLMANWSTFGSNAAKDMLWHKVIVRAASEEEIISHNVADDIAASIAVEAGIRASADGDIEAKYGVKVDINGYVSGYGLIATENNGVPTSEMVFLVDNFKIVKPGAAGSAATPTTMFEVGTVSGSTALTLKGSLIADKGIKTRNLHVSAKNLVVSPDIDADSDWWGSTYDVITDPTGRFDKVTRLVSAGNDTIYAPIVDIDPSKTYRIRCSIWDNRGDAVGTSYVGFYAYGPNDNTADNCVWYYPTTKGLYSAANSNCYAWSGDAAGWRDIEYYIQGFEGNPAFCDNGYGNNYNFQFGDASSRRLVLRFLNYYNSGTTKTMYVARVSVIEVMDGEIYGERITAGSIQTKSLAVGDGVNLLPKANPCAAEGITGYFLMGTGFTATYTLRNDTYAPSGGCPQVLQNDATASGYQDAWVEDPDSPGTSYDLPVTGNAYYCWSAYILSHRCNTQMYIQWLDSGKSHIQYSSNAQQAAQNINPAYQLNAYRRDQVIAQAPSNACYVRLFIRKLGTNSGGNSYMWFAKPQFEECTEGTVQPSAWRPSGVTKITNGNIATNSITADRLNVTDLSAISANLGTITVQTANIGTLVVGTSNLQNNAVSDLDASFVDTGVTFSNATETQTHSLSNVGTASGTTRIIMISFDIVGNRTDGTTNSADSTYIIRLKRGGVTKLTYTRVITQLAYTYWDAGTSQSVTTYSLRDSVVVFFLDPSGGGANDSYTVTVQKSVSQFMTQTVSNRFISATELKK